MKFEVPLLKHQMTFLRNQQKFLWLCAGLGAGKSHVLALYIINRLLTNPETLGLICASTYGQLRDSILAELFRQLQMMNLTYEYSLQTGFITLGCNGARAKVFSLDNYEVLRGIEIGWFALDEGCLAKEAAYNVILGRLRCRRSKALEGRVTSTPRGFDFMYDRYVGPLKDDNHGFIHATAYDNHFLPAEYIPSLKGQYSPKMFRQEVLAEFVSNAEGNVYWAFERAEHAGNRVLQMPGYPVYIGLDFNVSPFCGVLANVTNGMVRVFDEIYLKNSNTYAVRDEIRKRYEHDRIKLAPDATGASRKTSSTQSDHAILREAGFQLLHGKTNPAIEDRYNTVNGRLREGRIEIDSECKMLIRDLERVTNDSNPSYLTHISDALGYLAWQVFPVKTARPLPSVHQR